LLHPYNETDWNDQVLKESPVERAIRGSVHAEKSLMAGVTTMRDLGSEGAGYTDVYLKKCIDDGIIPGPRLLVAGPAIVATGAYGPKGFHDGVSVPLGAEPVSGRDEAIKEVRNQMGNGADLIKIYADYRWSPGATSQPTFLQEEIDAMVATATTAGKYVVAHASTPEGMRRAILGGVETIEHGDGGTTEIFKLMKEKNVALCPTLAAGDAIEQYKGWKKGKEADTDRIAKKKQSFALALQSGVDIVFGGDVGVFSHGENYRELVLMVEYGMQPLKALQSATSVNARVFHLENLGRIKNNFLADLIAVEGNPLTHIEQMQHVRFVMKDGVVYKNE
jgi:imidazolonepropionase-like amidohydrolase